MARFVYIDETGSVGASLRRQPSLTLVAAIVDEDQVQPLARSVRDLAMAHLGWCPADFEFHGHELWNGTGPWSAMSHADRLAAYKAVIDLLETHDIDLAHSTINRERLHQRYNGAWDASAYLLALQFLLEKVDLLGGKNKVLVADESKEQEVRAIRMVADLQSWSTGEVPGRRLTTIIDSLHFVSSRANAGVQMADLVAYIMGRRRRRASEGHPDAEAGMQHLVRLIGLHTRTYRLPWP